MEAGGHEFPHAREAMNYLEGVINDRRVQERREKILKDIDLIRSRRQNLGSGPVSVSPGHSLDQEIWFAKLESNWIWNFVFQYLTSLTDVWNAHVACQLFKNHLEQKLQLMQLPKVFNVLQQNSYIYYFDHSSSTKSLNWLSKDNNMRETSGFHSDHDKDPEKNRDVLNLRLLSKAWKKAAEEELLSEPLRLIGSGWESHICFSTSKDVDMAMEALPSKRKASPSLIRTVAISDSEFEDGIGADVEEFYSKLFQFLDIHGGSVLGLKFHFYRRGRGRSAECMYHRLRNVLSRLPNLISLDVVGLHSDTDITFDTPLPTMATLKMCQFGFLDNSPLIAEIIRNAPNLKAVQVGYGDSDAVWRSLGVLQLEKLELRCDRFEEALLRLGEQVWPLKELKMIVAFMRTRRVEASRLVAALVRFNATLEEVEVKCDRVMRNFELANGTACVIDDFPNLKRITLPQIVDI